MARTFSEIVDAVAVQTGYIGQLRLVISFANNAINQLRPIRHFSSLREDYINNGHAKLTVPMPQNYASMLSAQDLEGKKIYTHRRPGLGTLVNPTSHWFYESGDALVFNGYSRGITIAYYVTSKHFVYYAPEYRLLRSTETEGEHLYDYRAPQTNDWLPLDYANPQYSELIKRHTNWIITQHADVVLTGALSGAYNAKGQLDNGARMFQLFASERTKIQAIHEVNTSQEH